MDTHTFTSTVHTDIIYNRTHTNTRPKQGTGRHGVHLFTGLSATPWTREHQVCALTPLTPGGRGGRVSFALRSWKVKRDCKRGLILDERPSVSDVNQNRFPVSPSQPHFIYVFHPLPSLIYKLPQNSPLAFFRFTCFHPGRPSYSSLVSSKASCGCEERNMRVIHLKKEQLTDRFYKKGVFLCYS